MQGPTRLRRAPTFGSLAAIAGVALLASASTAAAADREYKGWYVALDAALTQPNSLDQHFANEFDPGSSDLKRLVIDNKSHGTFRGTVGYTFGSGMGSLQASYWDFDHEDRQNGSTTADLLPMLFGYNYSYTFMSLTNAPISFTATGNVKARTIDLDYVRPIAVNEKFSLKWLTGLRVARYEEDLGLTAIDNTPATYLQSRHIESRANGLRIGVTGVFGFTKHFSLEATLASSFLQAKTDGDASETFPTPSTQTAEASNDHLRGEIRDYDLKAIWSRYGRLDYYLGYSASEWDGLVTDPLPPGDCCRGTSESAGRTSISFNSLHAGVTVRLGRIRAAPRADVP